MPLALIDNFSLQSVAELLNEGVSDDQMVWPQIDRQRDAHRWEPVNITAFRLHALFDLLVHIVTRDQLVLCNEYRSAWEGAHPQLRYIEDCGVLTPRDFDAHGEAALAIKERVIAECSVTSSLRRKHKENVRGYARHGRSPNAYLATAMWGTAGNLARAAQAGCTYAPHPFRTAFLRQTSFSDHDATRTTLDWLDHERVSVRRKAQPGASKNWLQLILSPIVVQLIEANDLGLDGLIPSALELRDEYSGLRKWMTQYQAAIDDEDLRGMRSHAQTLQSVSDKLAGAKSEASFGITKVSTGTFFPSIPIPIPKPALIRHRIGIRATLDRLVFTKRGEGSLKKLLRSMGSTPRVTEQVIAHFRRPA